MTIPVCDLRDCLTMSDGELEALTDAVVEVGCFQLRNHGVPEPTLAAGVTAAQHFHSHDWAWKDRYSLTGSLGNRGYLPDDFTPVSAGSDRVRRDYASMDFGPEVTNDPATIESILLGPNRWPDPPGFRAAGESYRSAMNACATDVSRLFARMCGLHPEHIARRSTNGCSLLRLLHYPRPAYDPDGEPDGHTDYEWFTLIWQSSPGLEVLGRDGRSHLVPATPDTFTVLVGDLLEVLSGGRLESTLHWVRPRFADRYSLTYFYGPDFDETVASATGTPRPYPALHAGNHLTALRVRHITHLRAAVADGTLTLPFDLPAVNPLKAAKVDRLARARASGAPTA
jgi:isopenicillin N synthase-like dioxygenase